MGVGSGWIGSTLGSKRASFLTLPRPPPLTSRAPRVCRLQGLPNHAHLYLVSLFLPLPPVPPHCWRPFSSPDVLSCSHLGRPSGLPRPSPSFRYRVGHSVLRELGTLLQAQEMLCDWSESATAISFLLASDGSKVGFLI